MILSRSSLWQVNPLIEIMWGIFLLNTEDLLGERRLQTINYVVFIASWHKKCSYVLRQSCGPQKGAESCWPTENFILQLWKTSIFFFALPQLKREIRAWNLVFLKNGIVWFPSRSPGTIKAGREASLIDNLTKMSIVFGMPLFSAVSGWPKRSLFMQASCIMCCWAKCSFHSYETAAITITAS